MSHGGGYFSDNERERHSSGWDPSIRGGVLVQRRRDDVPIRSVEVFIVSSANVREVREDDSGHDLGVSDQPEEVRDVGRGDCDRGDRWLYYFWLVRRREHVDE